MPAKTRSPRKSLIHDKVNPSDFNKLKTPYSCEDCSFFAPKETHCTMGFLSYPHQRQQQLKSYELSGRIAICRFLEID